MIKVILVDEDVKCLGALQEILSQHFNQAEILISNLQAVPERQRIALTDKNGYRFFETMKIVRCQSDNSYTEFHIIDGKKQRDPIKIEVSKGLAFHEYFLLEKGFFYRVHNQHLININYIKRFVKDGSAYLVMDDGLGTTIPVARNRKEDFLNFLRQKGVVI